MDGLVISAGGSTVRGLIINDFVADASVPNVILNGQEGPKGGKGISLGTAGGNTIVGNFIGTDASGGVARPNTFSGVRATTAGNTIGGTSRPKDRNVISGNNFGVFFQNAGASGNLLQGNYIGVNAAGSADLGNTKVGVQINFAPRNTIGGTSDGAGNVISGNDLDGVLIISSDNIVQGNKIGTDVTGTAPLGNGPAGGGTLGGAGVRFFSGSHNTIGGTTPGARNIISGNINEGIFIAGNVAGGSFGSGSNNNVVQGNYIGTNAAGTEALGNGLSGISLAASTGNTIGGTTPSARNLISGNSTEGIVVTGAGGNLIQGNDIGTKFNGTEVLGNGFSGISLFDSAGNTIGGTTPGASNLISGNVTSSNDPMGSTNRAGITLSGGGTKNNVVQGNIIGPDVTGTAAPSAACNAAIRRELILTTKPRATRSVGRTPCTQYHLGQHL